MRNLLACVMLGALGLGAGCGGSGSGSTATPAATDQVTYKCSKDGCTKTQTAAKGAAAPAC